MKLSLILCFIVLCISVCDAYRFLAIYALGGKSHFIMFNSFLKGLTKRGHQVDVISVLPPKEEEGNYTQIINATLMEDSNDNVDTDFVKLINDYPVFILAHRCGRKMCSVLLQPGVKKFMQNLKFQSRYDAIVYHHMADYCYAFLGKLLNVPVILLVTSAPYSWHLDSIGSPNTNAYATDRLSTYTSSLTFMQRTYNVLYTAILKFYIRYTTEIQISALREVFGSEAPTSLSELQSQASLILVNSHMSFHGVLPSVPSLVEVGGLHIQEKNELIPTELKAWLDQSSSGFIYMSFGTLVKFVSLPTELLQAFYKSLGKIAPVRVIIKVPNANQLPPGLPSNVRTFSWAPQLKVLCHKNARAFVTHSGLLSTQEAIYCGVPVIAVPFFLDQFENAEICAARNIGVKIDSKNLTEASLDEAFNLILQNSTYRESMKKISQKFLDRPMSPLDTACYWTEYVIKYGKDSLRPTAANLAWWERDLLDVYGFIFVTIIFISFIITKILKHLYKFLLNDRIRTSTLESKKLQ